MQRIFECDDWHDREDGPGKRKRDVLASVNFVSAVLYMRRRQVQKQWRRRCPRFGLSFCGAPALGVRMPALYIVVGACTASAPVYAAVERLLHTKQIICYAGWHARSVRGGLQYTPSSPDWRLQS